MSSSVSSSRNVSVLADALPGARARDVGLVITGAILTSVCAHISLHVPPSPVPITAQTLAVILAGGALGSVRGGASQVLYLLLGLVLPVYAGGVHGWSVITGATGGYLVAFPIAAFAIGYLAEHGRGRRLRTAFAAYVVGQLTIFGIGVPWLMFSAGLTWPTAVHEGFTIFIVGGLIKAGAAGVLTSSAWRAVQRYQQP